MLTAQNLIYFGPEKWVGLWRNRHQLMSRFAKTNRVLYVEPKIYLRKVRQRWRTKEWHWGDLLQELKQSRVTRVRDNLYVFHSPTFIPISGRYPLDRMTWFLWRGFLKLALRKLSFDEPIIWLSRPSMVNLIGAFNEKLAIYHVVDEYLSYCQDDIETRMRQQTLERQMLKKAHLVIVVSESLLQAKRPFNQNTCLVQNGVDYSAYARVVDNGGSLPPDIAHLPKPVIGYSGLIGARLDLGLLQHLATSHPEWSLVLLGAVDDRQCAAGLTRLMQMENVYFLGRKAIDQVPDYIQAFDLCLIPYEVDERARNASPLKLYDYLATGKPIVTTNFPTANIFKDVVHVADTWEEFIRYIREALSENDTSLFSKRRRIAAANTWDQRVEQLSHLIQSCLEVDHSRVEDVRK